MDLAMTVASVVLSVVVVFSIAGYLLEKSAANDEKAGEK